MAKDILQLRDEARAANLANRSFAVDENVPATRQIPAPNLIKGLDVCRNSDCDNILVFGDGMTCRQCVLQWRYNR